MTPQEWYDALGKKPEWMPEEDKPQQPSMSAEDWYKRLEIDPYQQLGLKKANSPFPEKKYWELPDDPEKATFESLKREEKAMEWLSRKPDRDTDVNPYINRYGITPFRDVAHKPAISENYDTLLTAEEENAFQRWKAINAPNDSGFDYDLRGAFKAGVSPDPNSGHWPDTFKKPNHPTFSDQSKYAPYAPDKAGRWEGETFIPPETPKPMSPDEWYRKLETDPFASLGLPKRTGKPDAWTRYESSMVNPEHNAYGKQLKQFGFQTPTDADLTGEEYRRQKYPEQQDKLPLPGQSPGLSRDPLTGQPPTAVTNKAGQSFPDYFLAEKAKGIADLFTGPQRAYQKGMTLDEEIAWANKASNVAMTAGMPMAKSGSAGIFGGRLAAGADLQNLALAEQMAAKGFDRKQIWDATGWFQGKDNKWRFEIPDENFIVNYGKGQGVSGPEMAHPDLKKAYGFEELTHETTPSSVEMGAYYSPSSIQPGGHINVAGTTIEKNMIHELMHAVQQKEGFAKGGSFQAIHELALKMWERESPGITKTTKGRDSAKQAAREVYNRLAGEVEARNVERRLSMPPEERKRIPPWETEDRPREIQNVIFGK